MAKRKVRVKADGRLTLPDLAEVAAAFSALLAAMTKLKSKDDAPIEWVLDNSKFGSIDFYSVGLALNKSGEAAVSEIYDDYVELSRMVTNGVTDDVHSDVLEQVERLARVSRRTQQPVYLGVGDDDSDLLPILPSLGDEVSEDSDSPPVSLRMRSRTSVRGTIVTCDDKGATYFTLCAASDGRNIRCYPDASHRPSIATFWASKTTVLVEGTFSRYKTVPTMTGITQIAELGMSGGNEWRLAIGSAPAPEKPAMSTVDAIRRFRDGQG